MPVDNGAHSRYYNETLPLAMGLIIISGWHFTDSHFDSEFVHSESRFWMTSHSEACL